MAGKYILDTNLYIDAIRDPEKEKALDTFLERNAPVTYMSAVVMQELRAGAVTDAQASALDKGIFEVFARRRRLIAPSVAAFKECGRILAAQFRKDGVPFKERPRSLVNDILIALTCRENGVHTPDKRRRLQNHPSSSARTFFSSGLAGIDPQFCGGHPAGSRSLAIVAMRE